MLMYWTSYIAMSNFPTTFKIAQHIALAWGLCWGLIIKTFVLKLARTPCCYLAYYIHSAFSYQQPAWPRSSSTLADVGLVIICSNAYRRTARSVGWTTSAKERYLITAFCYMQSTVLICRNLIAHDLNSTLIAIVRVLNLEIRYKYRGLNNLYCFRRELVRNIP